jgi:hypothetical protein
MDNAGAGIWKNIKKDRHCEQIALNLRSNLLVQQYNLTDYLVDNGIIRKLMKTLSLRCFAMRA